MMPTLESIQVENVDSIGIREVDSCIVGSTINNEIVKEICYDLRGRMPLLMDSTVYCQIGKSVIENLCLIVASLLRSNKLVDLDVKKEACRKMFEIANEAATQIHHSANQFTSDAEKSGLLFSSGMGVTSCLCCPFQTAFRLMDNSSSFYLDNTTISKGFQAALIEKLAYFDSLEATGLEPSLDSSSIEIIIEDWVGMTQFSEFETRDDLRVLGSVPRSLSAILRTSTTINSTWYVVWQVLWPVHMFAIEFLDESVYSMVSLASSLKLHPSVAEYAVGRRMSEDEQLNHSILQCCKPLSTKPNAATASKSKSNRIAPNMVYEGPVTSFPSGVEVPPGWIQRSFKRLSGASAGHIDNYWYPPGTQLKLRSFVEIKRYLKENANNGDDVAAFGSVKEEQARKKIKTDQGRKENFRYSLPINPTVETPLAQAPSYSDLSNGTFRKLINCLKSVVALKDPSTKYRFSDIFLEKPDPEAFPDYYEIIEKPIAIIDILRKCRAKLYKNILEFQDDWKLMFKNAMQYNGEGSWVVDNARALERGLQRVMKKNGFVDDQKSPKSHANVAKETRDKDFSGGAKKTTGNSIDI